MTSIIKHFILALLLVGVMGYLTLLFIQYWTHHDQYVEVPDLSQHTLQEVEHILGEKNLRFQVLDSSEYQPSFPKRTVVSQTPVAFSKVKERRKIYLTLNPSDYRKVTLPRLIQLTKRNAEATLKAIGLEVGSITYKDHIGKDMVLEMHFHGEEVFAGEQLPQKSKIDLVCGNGNEASPIDSLNIEVSDSLEQAP